MTNLEPRRASVIAQRLLAAESDEEAEAAAAEAPEVQDLVREANAKPDRRLWKKVVRDAAVALLATIAGGIIDYQAKEQAHEDAKRQIELAEEQLEVAERERARQAETFLDQEAVNELVAQILREVVEEGHLARQEERVPATTTATPRKATVGRNHPCWCGSGEKYKFCHLRDDRLFGYPLPSLGMTSPGPMA